MVKIKPREWALFQKWLKEKDYWINLMVNSEKEVRDEHE